MEVTRVEQHAYIKIAVLRERNAMESHSELVEALGNNALPYSTVARWIGKFQQGRVSTSEMSNVRDDRYESPVSGTVVTYVGAPVAWGLRIIDTADTAVATPLL
ncbi:HTH_48 domain-containing protein [Trichonephila clavipes]|nr:HTH_48 domain-containing protein [Trichonephila clavipes]